MFVAFACKNAADPPAVPETTVDLAAVGLGLPSSAALVRITRSACARGEVFEGVCLDGSDPLSGLLDGDVAVHLCPCDDHGGLAPGLHAAVYLAHDGRLHPAGRWCALGADWVEAVRDTVNVLMALHTVIEVNAGPCSQRLPAGTALPALSAA
jgi:hypothetical protein